MNRLQKIKLKYPDANVDDLKDPSTNNKYLDWMAGQLAHHSAKQINSAILKFHATKLEQNDLYQYANLKELKSELEKKKPTRKKRKKSGAKLIYKEEEELAKIHVHHISSYEAIKLYGSDTQWCVTGESDYYEYVFDNNVFFIIMQQNTHNSEQFSTTTYYKYILRINLNTFLIDMYDQQDDEVEPSTYLCESVKAALSHTLKHDSKLLDPITNKLETKRCSKLIKTASEDLILQITGSYYLEDNIINIILKKEYGIEICINIIDNLFHESTPNEFIPLISKVGSAQMKLAALKDAKYGKHISLFIHDKSSEVRTNAAWRLPISWINKIDSAQSDVKEILYNRKKTEVEKQREC